MEREGEERNDRDENTEMETGRKIGGEGGERKRGGKEEIRERVRRERERGREG